jgi:TolB-like protein
MGEKRLVTRKWVVAVCLVSLLAIFRAGAAWSVGNTYGLNYSEPVGGDYLYRTERVIKPPASKTLWDYLSFFAWKSKKVEVDRPPAAESMALKARIADLAKQLVTNSTESIAEEYVVTVNSFVNLNNLYKTSALGRYISEELMGNLQLAGIEVLDVRKSAGIMIHAKSGEYGLSREMKELSYIHSAQAMVVGTYTYADGQIFLNARILRNGDGMVMSNASLAFDLDSVTRQMLADEAAPPRKAGVVRVQKFSTLDDSK